MTRKILSVLILASAPALGGCALQAAMLAAELVPEIKAPMGQKNAHLRPAAQKACTDRAAQHGSVFVSDVEQRRADLLIVWGSVTDAQRQRRIFECQFTTRLSGFRLGEVIPPS